MCVYLFAPSREQPLCFSLQNICICKTKNYLNFRKRDVHTERKITLLAKLPAIQPEFLFLFVFIEISET